MRTVQRDLLALSTSYDLICDDREKPFGWSWAAGAVRPVVAEMDVAQALAFNLLHREFKDLMPPEIVWRKDKIGFEPPFEEWWPSNQKIIDTINNSTIVHELFNKKFKKFTDREFEWRLYNLAVWENQYNMHL